MNALTGAAIDGDAHLEQSIFDILATPIGSRVERRDYGSALAELVDAPVNPLTRIRAFAATALALTRWEPRISVKRVVFSAEDPSQPRIEIFATRADGARKPIVSFLFPLRTAQA